MWAILRAAGLGLIGFLVPRLLVGLGAPLEQWARALGAHLGASADLISQSMLLNSSGLLMALMAFTAELWWKPVGKVFGKLKGISKSRASSQQPKLLQLIELISEAREQGWIFSGESAHILDLVHGLRQAAISREIRFWARQKQDFSGLARAEPLREVQKEHWNELEIDPMSCLEIDLRNGTTNIPVDNFRTSIGKPLEEACYVDIHVDWEPALHWLSHDAKKYMGRTSGRINSGYR